MAIQVGISPPSGTALPPVTAAGSYLPPSVRVVGDVALRRQPQLKGKQVANCAANTVKKNIRSTTREFLAAGGLALGLASLGLFASAGTAAADGLDATPMPPAVIDEDGFQTYDTSSYPADPTWPAPPSWGSYPADPTWPGKSSAPCCSR
jgi:hypothetical protein